MKNLIHFYAIAFLLFLAACAQKKDTQVATASVKSALVMATPPKIKDTICIAAVGDMMLGTSYPNETTLPPDSGQNSFARVKQYLQSADLAFGNLEGSLINGGIPGRNKMHFQNKQFHFRMPTKYAGIFKDAGFDVLSVANNHSGDFADSGRMSTMNVLDSVGVKYAGLVTCPLVQFELNGVKYGFCAFAPNSLTVSIYNFKAAAAIIRELKQQCDVVIVSFHGGGEGVAFEHVPFADETFNGESRGNVYAFAHNAIDAGADLVFGNGPHVSRAMELYNNRLIAYSLGNFCTYRMVNIEGLCGIAPLLKVNINRKGEFLNAQIISVQQSRINGLSVDTLNRAAKRIKLLTEADFPESRLQISEGGEIKIVEEKTLSKL